MARNPEDEEEDAPLLQNAPATLADSAPAPAPRRNNVLWTVCPFILGERGGVPWAAGFVALFFTRARASLSILDRLPFDAPTALPLSPSVATDGRAPNARDAIL